MTMTWTEELTTRATSGTDAWAALLDAIDARPAHPEGEWVMVFSREGRVEFRPGADIDTFQRRSLRAFDLYVAFLEGGR